MGRRPGPERKSARKAAANRANGARPKLASRKGKPTTEARLRKNLERLRNEGVPLCVQLALDIAADRLKVRGRRVPVPLELRVRVSESILDRAGLPRGTTSAVTIDHPAKLVELGDGKSFPAPPHWNGHKSPEAIVANGSGHELAANGNGVLDVEAERIEPEAAGE